MAASKGQTEDITILKSSRPYEPGDPMKRINWRLLAGSGRMEVNVYEKAMPGCAAFLLALEERIQAFSMMSSGESVINWVMSETGLVLLGTGTPNAEPNASGPFAAVVVGDQVYLVDFGPGVVRQCSRAYRKGITALHPKNLRTAFCTHLHTDHRAGYSDLIFTPWVLERKEPLRESQSYLISGSGTGDQQWSELSG